MTSRCRCTGKMRPMQPLTTQLFVGAERPAADRMQPVQNDSPAKPAGGLWTSTWQPQTRSAGWTEWCAGEDLAPWIDKPWWLMTPQPDRQVATINSLGDLKWLVTRYHRTAPEPLSALYNWC